MGFEDVLGHAVLGGRPVFFKEFAVRVAQGGNVVDQGVGPDIGDEAVVKGQFNAPGQAGLGPGDAEIFQRLLEEAEHFVAVAFRPDVIRIVADVVNEPVLILAHGKEVVFFLDIAWFLEVVRAEAVDQFLFRVETFAAEAVVPAILAEIDIAPVIDPIEDILDHLDVAGAEWCG